MSPQYTPVYKKIGKQYVGWIKEVPGANTQGKTFKEVKENLCDALRLILESCEKLKRGGHAKYPPHV